MTTLHILLWRKKEVTLFFNGPYNLHQISCVDRSKVKPFLVSSFRKLAGHYCLVFALKRFGKSEVQRYNSRCRVPLKQNKIFGNSNLLLLTFVSLMKNVSSFIAVERNHPSASELAPSL
jgi:hypothetical protein